MKIDKLIRSRRKSISLMIEPDGQLLVRAPLWLPQADIQRFVDEHAAWVKEKRSYLEAHPQPVKHRFNSGEVFYFLGQPVRLERIKQPASRQPLRFLPAAEGTQAVFKLAAPNQARAAELLIAWYKAQTRQICTQRVTAFASQYGFEYAHLRISSARTRWGSCSSRGTLSLTWRLVCLPPEMIDYVILHELVHTIERNHGAKFWERLQTLQPDCKERRAWIKKYGPSLIF